MKKTILLALTTLTGVAFADSTIDSTQKYAYAANAGWLNAKWSASPVEGVVVSEHVLSGRIYSANFGWIDLGDGSPSNGYAYSQSGGEFGVNNEGGRLTGLAYGANIGWISFDWVVGDDLNEPKIDLSTGKFSGLAYSANVGWIKFDASASAFLETDSMLCPDSDTDGIADWWERQNAGNLTTYNASSDKDKDGVIDLDEYLALTDPEDPKSFMQATGTYAAGATTFSLTFSSNEGRLYEIETGTDLIGWADSGLGTFAPDSGNSTTRVITIVGSPTEERRFFRAIAVKPL